MVVVAKSMGDEQQAAAEEHGGEQPILSVTHAIANDADEPQKRDAGERQQVESENDGIALAALVEPVIGTLGIARHGEAHEYQCGGEQHRERDPGEGRSARRAHRP
jgi:hypothetical protein